MISRFAGSPISSSDPPAITTCSLSLSRLSTVPSAGASTLTDFSLAALVSGSISRASALRSSLLRRSSAACISLTCASAVSTSAVAFSKALTDIVDRLASSLARSRSERFTRTLVSALITCASASATAALAASTAACNSRRLRTSRKAGWTAWTDATAVRLATTLSPTSTGRRSTRPVIGAETTKTSRMRAIPSSSTVTSIGPRSRVARSTATGCGRSA